MYANIINNFTIINSDIGRDNITFTVSSLGNFADKVIPARTFSKVTCGWIYKGDKCLYTSSDPSLSTSISRCNKLLRSYAFKGKQITLSNPGPGGGNDFTLTSAISEDMEDYILGCIVETTTAPYLWRITAVNGTVLTITSYRNSIPLNRYVVDGAVQVNVYEKECCFGHSDTGTLVVNNPAYGNKFLRGFCKYNDLVFNGDFNNLVGANSLERWTITPSEQGAIELVYGYAFITRPVTLEHQLYDNYVKILPTDPDVVPVTFPLETGKRFNLVFRYYGASTVSGESRSMYYRLSANMGGTVYYWNATTKSFQLGTLLNAIPLRSYNQRLSIENFSDEQKREIRFLKFDEYISSIVFSYGSATEVREINLFIQIPSGAEVAFNYISCILQNQFERFGGFPAIPTTRFWYF